MYGFRCKKGRRDCLLFKPLISSSDDFWFSHRDLSPFSLSLLTLMLHYRLNAAHEASSLRHHCSQAFFGGSSLGGASACVPLVAPDLTTNECTYLFSSRGSACVLLRRPVKPACLPCKSREAHSRVYSRTVGSSGGSSPGVTVPVHRVIAKTSVTVAGSYNLEDAVVTGLRSRNSFLAINSPRERVTRHEDRFSRGSCCCVSCVVDGDSDSHLS